MVRFTEKKLIANEYFGPVQQVYKASFSAFFSVGTVFFSHKKSARLVFQLIF
jgi:hypothetical protein